MTRTLIHLGMQPHVSCQRCGLYERDRRGWCHCALTHCPVGLLLRRRRQRATPPALVRDRLARASAEANPATGPPG